MLKRTVIYVQPGSIILSIAFYTFMFDWNRCPLFVIVVSVPVTVDCRMFYQASLQTRPGIWQGRYSTITMKTPALGE